MNNFPCLPKSLLAAFACLLATTLPIAPASAQSNSCGVIATKTLLPGTGCHAPAGWCPGAPVLDGTVIAPWPSPSVWVTTPGESAPIVVFGFGLPSAFPIPLLTSPCGGPCTLVLDPLTTFVGFGFGAPVYFPVLLPPVSLCGVQIRGQAAVLGVGFQLSNAVDWTIGV